MMKNDSSLFHFHVKGEMNEMKLFARSSFCWTRECLRNQKNEHAKGEIWEKHSRHFHNVLIKVDNKSEKCCFFRQYCHKKFVYLPLYHHPNTHWQTHDYDPSILLFYLTLSLSTLVTVCSKVLNFCAPFLQHNRIWCQCRFFVCWR